MIRHTVPNAWLLLLAILLLPLPRCLLALPTDREQPFNIEADSAEFDEAEGVSRYQGNVEVTQGTMVLRADEIEIRTRDSAVIQITARMRAKSGSLAHFRQLPEENAEMVEANAREINYLVQEERIHLIGNARLTQEPNRFAGELLHYDLRNGIVNLKGSTDDTKGRIKLQLQPKTE